MLVDARGDGVGPGPPAVPGNLVYAHMAHPGIAAITPPRVELGADIGYRPSQILPGQTEVRGDAPQAPLPHRVGTQVLRIDVSSATHTSRMRFNFLPLPRNHRMGG